MPYYLDSNYVIIKSAWHKKKVILTDNICGFIKKKIIYWKNMLICHGGLVV